MNRVILMKFPVFQKDSALAKERKRHVPSIHKLAKVALFCNSATWKLGIWMEVAMVCETFYSWMSKLRKGILNTLEGPDLLVGGDWAKTLGNAET